jgi:hypothetical protein
MLGCCERTVNMGNYHIPLVALLEGLDLLVYAAHNCCEASVRLRSCEESR